MSKQSAWGAVLSVSGMALLAAGKKKLGLGLFLEGVRRTENDWRKNNPDFQGSFSERWDRATTFYNATHANPMNRKLHMVGIPMIVGGALGLLLTKPYRAPWLVSMTSFVVGWGFNIAGHAVFEKNKPAFADDPLSFIAGPVWDIQQMFGKTSSSESSVTTTAYVEFNKAETEGASVSSVN